MPQVIPKFKQKGVMDGTYSEDQTLDIEKTSTNMSNTIKSDNNNSNNNN